MRLAHYVVLAVINLIFATISRAADQDALSKDDIRLARQYGYSIFDLRDAHKAAKKRVNRESVMKDVGKALENDPMKAAEYTDVAIENLLSKANVFLKAQGHEELAEEIEMEYLVYYRGAVQASVLGIKEIGDHPPLSEWLANVHNKIHDALGDWLCKQLHTHDLLILNYSIPVVFSPKQYKLKDYLDHFSGHLIWGFFWEHHGFAGVVTYWVVDGICIGATYGLGIVTFVCGPIATFAEHVMDKRIAPPIGERIWQRAQQDN